MADERTAPLSGTKVLVVEDEYYLADDLSRELRAAGAGVVGPFGSIADAKAAIDIGDFDCAVLDMNLRGDLAFMIAEQLASTKVPFIVATGYNQSSLPESLKDIPRLEKPFTPQQAVELLIGMSPKSHIGA